MPVPDSPFSKDQGAVMNATPPGEGLAILVVDDETLIAMLPEDLLLDLGCTVMGPAGSVAQSLALVQGSGRMPDGALLDINLRGELVYPVADVLTARGVPFVFITGNARHGIDPRYAAIPAVAKPFSSETITDIVRSFEKRRNARPGS
jgi:CheY-like chemotaxis protein